MYELQDHAVLASAPYLARLNEPSPWSTTDDAAAPGHGSHPVPRGAEPWRGDRPSCTDDPLLAGRRPRRSAASGTGGAGGARVATARHRRPARAASRGAIDRTRPRNRRSAAMPIVRRTGSSWSTPMTSARWNASPQAELGDTALHALGAAPGCRAPHLRTRLFRNAGRCPLIGARRELRRALLLPGRRPTFTYLHWRQHEIHSDQVRRDSRLRRRGHGLDGAGHPGAHDQVRPPEQHRPPDQHGRQEVRRTGHGQERRQDQGDRVREQPAGQRAAAAVGDGGRRAGDAGGLHHLAGRHRQGVRPARLPVPLHQRAPGRRDGRRPAGQGARRPAGGQGHHRPRLLRPRVPQRHQQQAARSRRARTCRA